MTSTMRLDLTIGEGGGFLNYHVDGLQAPYSDNYAGITLTDDGTIEMSSNLRVHGTSIFDHDVNIGTGGEQTGITLQNEGNITTSDALLVHGTSTFDLLTQHWSGLITGSGYTGIGATLSPLGELSMDSWLIVGGTAEIVQNSTFGGDMDIGYHGFSQLGTTLTATGGISMRNALSVHMTSTMRLDLTIGEGGGFLNYHVDGLQAPYSDNYAGITLTDDGTIEMSSNLRVHGTSIFDHDVNIGTGGEQTGITLQNEGNITTSDALLVHGTSTFDHDVTVGTGGDATGVTLTNEGNVTMSADFHVHSTSIFDHDVVIGTGGSATGITLTNEGTITSSDSLTVYGTGRILGTSTFIGLSTHSDGLFTGSGYLGTGATLSAAGELSMDSNLMVGGTAEVVSNSTLRGDVEIEGKSTLGNEVTDHVTVKGSTFASDETNPEFNFGASALVRF